MVSLFSLVFFFYQYIPLDGNSLTTADLVNLGQGLFRIKVSIFTCALRQRGDKHADVCCLFPVQLTPEAEEKVIKGREVIDTFIREDSGMVFLLMFFKNSDIHGSFQILQLCVCVCVCCFSLQLRMESTLVLESLRTHSYQKNNWCK